jgi:uncharacterized protein
MSDPYSEGSVTGFLHQPVGPVGGGLVLTHGAGLNCQAPLLVALADEFARHGILVLRCDLAFRKKRAVGPPFPAAAAADREGLREAVAQLTRRVPSSVFLGGHSYGGRQASILMTEPDPPKVAALLLLSFPLHPPRKPEQLRSSHFPALTTPAFFFHGTRDSFGSPGELEKALALIPGSTPSRLVLAEKAGHELAAGRDPIPPLCVSEFLRFAGLQDASQ